MKQTNETLFFVLFDERHGGRTEARSMESIDNNVPTQIPKPRHATVFIIIYLELK